MSLVADRYLEVSEGEAHRALEAHREQEERVLDVRDRPEKTKLQAPEADVRGAGAVLFLEVVAGADAGDERHAETGARRANGHLRVEAAAVVLAVDAAIAVVVDAIRARVVVLLSSAVVAPADEVDARLVPTQRRGGLRLGVGVR